MSPKGFWTFYSADNSPLPPGAQIAHMAAGSDGRVWLEVIKSNSRVIGEISYEDAYTYGIMVYERGAWGLFPLNQLNLPELDVRITHMICDRSGALWMNIVPRSAKRIICCFDGQNVTLFHSGYQGLPEDMGALTAMLADGGGTVWITMGAFGAYYFEGGIWKKFALIEEYLSNGWVNNIAVDNKKQLCFSIQQTNSTSFISFNGENCQRVITVPVGYERANVQTMTFDPNGNLWVAWLGSFEENGSGVWKLTASKKKWEKFTDKNSVFLNTQIENIISDQNGRIWITTAEGVIIIDKGKLFSWGAVAPSSGHEPISQRDALVLVEKELLAGKPPTYILIGGEIVADSGGRIWIGSSKGVGVFTEVI